MQGRSLIRTIDLGVALGVLVMFITLAGLSWMARLADRQTLALESRLVREEMQAALSGFENSIYNAGSAIEVWQKARADARAVIHDAAGQAPMVSAGSAVAKLMGDPASLERLKALSQVLRAASASHESRSDFIQLGSGLAPTLVRAMRLPRSAGQEALALEIWDPADIATRLSDFDITLLPFSASAGADQSAGAIGIVSAAGETVANLVWQAPRLGRWFERFLLPVLAGVLFLALWSMLLLRNRWRAESKAFKREIAAVKAIALTDALSGLPNRRAIFEHVARLAPTLAAVRPSTILLIDLDGFKSVNDTFGHRVGDEVIQKTAHCFAAFFAGDDFVGRLGGDEFVATVPGGLTQLELERRHVALSEALATALGSDHRLGKISISIGAVVCDGMGGTSDSLIRLADIALYQAKARGRARGVLYTPELERDATFRRTMERELREAVQRNELILHHQPIVDAISGEVRGYESLVRWRHPVRGIVSPAEFIPIAEESELIVEIGTYVLERAIAELASAGSCYISVNVTGRQLLKAGLAGEVAALIAKYRLDPGRLCLEVTETSLIADGERVAAVMAEIRELGVRFAIDDFGAGYSSLGYLLKFKFDILKIDRDFIITLDDKPEASMIVMSIVSLARSLGMRVVGEGVETPAQHRFLASAGCALVQGYLFGRPAAAADLALVRPALEPTILQLGQTRAA